MIVSPLLAVSYFDRFEGPPPPPAVSRPPSVAAALRVLEVQQQLDVSQALADGPPKESMPSNVQAQNRPRSVDNSLADGEKAILRQMCNVSIVIFGIH